DDPARVDRRRTACDQREVEGRERAREYRDDRERDREVRECPESPAQLLGVTHGMELLGIGLDDRRFVRCCHEGSPFPTCEPVLVPACERVVCTTVSVGSARVMPRKPRSDPPPAVEFVDEIRKPPLPE